MIEAMSTVRLWRMPTPSANSPASSRSRAGLRRVGSMTCLLWCNGASIGRGDRVILDRLAERRQGMENRNRQVLLKRRPIGAPTTADFDIADGAIPDPGNGEAPVHGLHLALAPDLPGRS